MTRRFFAALAAGVVTAAIATPAEAAPKRCDPLGGGECLLPFPNDYFTKKDRRTETGRRLALPRAGMPANKDGVRIDPRDWNRADGFSPGQQITVFLKGLTTERAARRNKLVPITDIARSLDRKQRVVLIDAETGERQLIWAEVDSAAPKASRRALLIRPAENLAEGRRYVVALRNLRTTSGKRIKPSFAFRVHARRQEDALEVDRAAAEVDAARLQGAQAGGHPAREPRRGLGLHGRERRVHDRRHAAHARHGVRGARRHRPRRPRGPRGTRPRSRWSRTSRRRPRTPRSPAWSRARSPSRASWRATAARSARGCNRDAAGRPAQKPGNVYTAFYRCVIPRGLPAGGGRALIYGHGLLGRPLDSGDSAQGQLKTLAAQKGFTVCGTYWSGLSAANGDEDTLQAAAAIQDLSRFGQITDRLQQGMLNDLFLGRAMVAADGLRSHPAFAGAFDATQRLYYDGNSQGGISGGALTAVAPDFDRAVLGVPGMNYSTLLSRSVDFTPFRTVLDASYTDELDRSLIYSLLTNLWDRGEANGYAHHMTSDPLPGTPAAPGAAPCRARRPPGGAGHGGGRGAHDRRARLEPAGSGPQHRRRPVPRDPGPDGLPVHGLGADRVRRGPALAGQPAGDAPAADGQRPAARRARIRTSSRAGPRRRGT